MTQVYAATRIRTIYAQLTVLYLHKPYTCCTDLVLASLMFEFKFKTFGVRKSEQLTSKHEIFGAIGLQAAQLFSKRYLKILKDGCFENITENI